MGLQFPSREFDEAVTAVCHGLASDQQSHELNALLLCSPDACDEYILRIELHSRLASSPDYFVSGHESPDGIAPEETGTLSGRDPAAKAVSGHPRHRLHRALAIAASLTLLLVGWSELQRRKSAAPDGATSSAVAMIDLVVDAKWSADVSAPQLQAPLEPGWLKLESGLAQVVFYSGARVVIEGPTDLQVISPSLASCSKGRVTAEVPEQAYGFRILTPHGRVSDFGTELGLQVSESKTELHVFKGKVQFHSSSDGSRTELQERSGAVFERSLPARLIAADSTRFPSIRDLQEKSQVAEALRHEQWLASSETLNQDPSLLVHFDFEGSQACRWRLSNASSFKSGSSTATMVGCRWDEGRWPGKSAIEFFSVNDRVRLDVPGEYDSLTLTAWVRVQGLDRKFNSLLMCEGFEPGTVHWLIRNDGALGLTVVGQGSGKHEIFASPPVLTLDHIGMWLHLAVVLDGNSKLVTHYFNGVAVSEKSLRADPPFHIGVAELGNWNSLGFPGHDSALIRNFSGAVDEFCLFSRALDAKEIQSQFREGTPQIK